MELARARAVHTTFADLIEENPSSVDWHTDAERDLLIGKMSAINKAKLEAAKRAGRRMVGCVYKRTRHDERGLRFSAPRFASMMSQAACGRWPAARVVRSSLWSMARKCAVG